MKLINRTLTLGRCDGAIQTYNIDALLVSKDVGQDVMQSEGFGEHHNLFAGEIRHDDVNSIQDA